MTRIAIADVMGHGEAVSQISGWLYDSLAARMNSVDGNLVLEDLNRATAEKGFSAMSTATIAAFYRSNSSLYFSYAGHHQLLLLSKNQSEWTSLDIDRGKELSGLPLGKLSFHQQEVVSQVGDRLFLYTDGVIEAMNRNDEQFGVQRLLTILNRFGGETELTDIRKRSWTLF